MVRRLQSASHASAHGRLLDGGQSGCVVRWARVVQRERRRHRRMHVHFVHGIQRHEIAESTAVLLSNMGMRHRRIRRRVRLQFIFPRGRREHHVRSTNPQLQRQRRCPAPGSIGNVLRERHARRVGDALRFDGTVAASFALGACGRDSARDDTNHQPSQALHASSLARNTTRFNPSRRRRKSGPAACSRTGFRSSRSSAARPSRRWSRSGRFRRARS